MDFSKFQETLDKAKGRFMTREKTTKFSPGKNRIRLLAGWRETERNQWFQDFGQHFIKDEAEQIQAIYICLDATFNKPCPICQSISKARKVAKGESMEKVLNDANASRVILVNALMLDSKEPNTPVILELKPSVFKQIVEGIEEWGPEAVFSPEKGHEIVVNRDGKGLNTKYTAAISPKVFAAPAAVMEQLHDLDKYVAQENEANQIKALNAVNTVAGLLAAPAVSSRDKPVTTDDDLNDFDAIESTATATSSVNLGEDLDSLLDDL